MLYFAFVAVFLILWGCFYGAIPTLEHATAVPARAFARLAARYGRVGRFTNRVKAYVPIVLIVVAGGLIVAWAGDQFIDLAELVHTKSVNLQRVDTVSHAWAVSKRTPADTSFFTVMSDVGSPAGMMSIAGLVAIVLVVMKKWRWVLYLVVTAGGGALLNLELKRYFARARPAMAEMLMRAHGYSFPSGHAMGSTVVLLSLSYLAFRTATQWRWKAACLALAWTLILSIALSRVYLGAHWISDVAAGISVGALWVGITTISYETVRRIRLLRKARVSAS